MIKRFLLLVPIVFCAILWYSTTQVSAASEYSVISDTEISSSNGSLNIDSELKKKKSSLAAEMDTIAKGLFSSTTVTGDLEWTDSSGTVIGNFWATTDYSSLYNSTESTYFSFGVDISSSYKVLIPYGKSSNTGNGVSTSVNKTEIDRTVALIKKYKEAVKDGIVAGSVGNSFNVFTMYPKTNQIRVKDLIDPTSGGIKLTAYSDMLYSLDYFYSPILGRMDSADALKIDWAKQSSKVTVSYTSGGKLSLTVNQDYLKFIQTDSDEMKLLVSAQGSVIGATVSKVAGYKLDGVSNIREPQNWVDASMRLMLPNMFARSSTNTNLYAISSVDGYKVLDDVKLLISRNFVYVKSGNVYENKGSYIDFGIDLDSLVVYYTDLSTTKRVGTVIPLWYDESVEDVQDVTNGQSKLFFTGRKVKFANDYSGKITLDLNNKDLLGVVEKTGAFGITLRKFSFETPVSKGDPIIHTQTTVNPPFIMLKTRFGM
jgi:hypothetical protein